ncbi:uncharacterized protein PG998_012061 [Apiospora kogelbergensis]|uniref:uncharacterized protein n=1 Tax=Apiospora kogelbergensis TaxID=1337665 RepID=UPI00312EBAFE
MALPFPVPTSLAPGLVISRMTKEDTDAAAVVYHESFGSDPANGYWWPEDLAALLSWCSERMRLKMDSPHVRIFKVNDVETGEMVAYARWDVPKNSTKFGEWAGGETDEGTTTAATADQAAPATANAGFSPSDFPEGANVEIASRFFSALGESQKKHMTDDMLGLSLLCVSPRHFRRGIATALLAPMLDIADSEGRKSYLEATAAGKPVYERLGFSVVDVLSFDWDELTQKRNGLYKNYVMIRDPVAQK